MRFVKEHPELYEQLGHDAFFDRYAAMGDDLRKERKENPCPECYGTGKIRREAAWIICSRCKGWGVA